MRVLLIEDDRMFGRALVRGLSNQGMAVDWVHNGADGRAALANAEHALALLDMGLPQMSGVEVLKAVRAMKIPVPILVITARDGLDDRVSGLDLGADDYLVKPFELRELLARMRAVLRRHNGQAQSQIASGEIVLDIAAHAARYRDVEHVLSAREFALMQALVLHPGVILSRAQLEQHIYGWGEEVESNAIEFIIHCVRKRFDKEIIRNVRGAGWMVPRKET
jgi:two-component system, OmpR family, response regulator